MPVALATGAVLGQGVAMPVVFTTGAHGSRRAENVWRCRRCSSALLGASPVTMQRLCGVYGDGVVEGFSPYFYGFFRPPPLRS